MSHATVLVISKSPEDVERLLAPYDETLEVEEYEEDGEKWMHNPRGKWDWYAVGGRWSEMLVGPDGPCDQVRKSECDFEAMGLRAMESAGESWDAAQARRARPYPWDDEVLSMSREDYQRSRCHFGTFAVLTADGEWHEKGQLVWFGGVADEKEPRDWRAEHAELVRAADDDCWLTIVDYHT